MKPKAVFLDRDGTINKERSIISTENFELLPGTITALSKLSQEGYKLIIITNQGGINSGKYTKKDYDEITDYMKENFAFQGIKLDAVYHCPHTEADNCECRKPKPGMLEQAAKDFNIDTSKSWMIGDKITDIAAGKEAGCKTVLVGDGYDDKDKKGDVLPDYAAYSILSASKIILRNSYGRDLRNIPKHTNSSGIH